MTIFTTGYPAGYDPDEEIDANIGLECETPSGAILTHVYNGYSLNEALSNFCDRFDLDLDSIGVKREEDLPSLTEMLFVSPTPSSRRGLNPRRPES